MDMKAMWDSIYRDTFNSDSQPDPRFPPLVEKFCQSAGEAVDLGAGEGADAIWLARNGWRVTAVDYSEVAVQRLRERFTAESVSIEAVVGDATTFSLDRSVDLVYLGYLHLGLRAMEEVFARAWSLLKPGGVLIYLGITEVPVEDMPPGVDVSLFASRDELLPLLKDWTVLLQEQGPCSVDTGSGPEAKTGVTVVARRPDGAVR